MKRGGRTLIQSIFSYIPYEKHQQLVFNIRTKSNISKNKWKKVEEGGKHSFGTSKILFYWTAINIAGE